MSSCAVAPGAPGVDERQEPLERGRTEEIPQEPLEQSDSGGAPPRDRPPLGDDGWRGRPYRPPRPPRWKVILLWGLLLLMSAFMGHVLGLWGRALETRWEYDAMRKARPS